jgi:hypothetical protein
MGTPASLSRTKQAYFGFWWELLERMRSEAHPLHDPPGLSETAMLKNWIRFPSSRPKCWYHAMFISDGLLRVGLSMDSSDGNWNRRVLENLRRQRRDIEQELGFELEWASDNQACRVGVALAAAVSVLDLDSEHSGAERRREKALSWVSSTLRQLQRVLDGRLSQMPD